MKTLLLVFYLIATATTSALAETYRAPVAPTHVPHELPAHSRAGEGGWRNSTRNSRRQFSANVQPESARQIGTHKKRFVMTRR
jgi:hypothetical protein